MDRPTLRDTAGPTRFVDAHVHYWEQGAPDLDWPMLARPRQTVVIYMGAET